MATKRRPTIKPASKRKKAIQVAAKRERLKPVSLWPLTFDEALDRLLALPQKVRDRQS